MKLKNWICAVCVVSCTWCAVYGQTPQGAIPGLFSISEDKKVYFSQGNLLHNTDGTWSFAEHQYDDGDLFAWATSGYEGPAIGSHNIAYNVFEGSTYANYDWGVYNPISNGGNTPGLWRTLSREEWDYLLGLVIGGKCRADAQTKREWTTEEGVQGLKIMADEGETYVFLPAAGWKSSIDGGEITGKGTDGNYWTSTLGTDEPPSAEAFHFQNKEEVLYELWANHSRQYGMSVRLVYDSEAWIEVNDQNNNKALLEQYMPQERTLPINVHLVRSLTPGMYNTLCLPFDLTAKEVKDAFGETTQLAKFTSGSLGDEKKSLEVVFEEVSLSTDADIAIEAGVAYLIEPSQSVTNSHFYNRIIKLSAADGESFEETESVQYLGILNPHQLEAGNKRYLFLQANNTLAWSKAGDTSTMKGMRGYFYVPKMVDMPALCPARLSVRLAPQTPTGLGQGNKDKGQRTIKFMQNGKLFIEYNGVIYNMQGGREL